MSGHSKWSTIKHQKGAADAKRGALFTKFSRDIVLAVRQGGGGDPDTNFRLRLTIDKARGSNMPQDNILRAIKRGTGEGGEAVENLEEFFYEGYGSGGGAISFCMPSPPTETGRRRRCAPPLAAGEAVWGKAAASPGTLKTWE